MIKQDGENSKHAVICHFLPIMPETQPQQVEADKPKPALKICCACPETKKVRDQCVLLNGEEQCGDAIEAHKQCLRNAGFDVK